MSGTLAYLFLFVLGLGAGSFLNVLTYRIEQGMDIVRLRSHCVSCKHILNAVDLIPIFGFFIRRGRCRYCNVKISRQYPLVELSTGILFILVGRTSSFPPVSLGETTSFLYLIFLSSVLLAIAVYDFNYYLIPDIFVYSLAGAAAVYQFALLPLGVVPPLAEESVLQTLVGAGIGGGVFLFFYLVSKGRWMGMGDVKLGAAMGLFLGIPLILEALFLAFVAGGTVGILLIAAKKKTLKSALPFGPFLALSAVAALLWGEEILGFYLSLILR